MDNEVLKAIRSRRSVRRFLPTQVNEEDLVTILEAGTWAPTGHGTQGPWIVAVRDEDTCGRLRKLNAEVWGKDFDPYYGAPTIILVFAPKDNPNNIKDGSLVLGNMMLAAHSIGLGSCWINREDKMFETEEGKDILKGFSLPEEVVGVGALAIGYPASPPREPSPRKEGYWRIV